ncbi:5'-3' exonuclease family protein isoform 1 [Rhynchospora pubera]|uniref:Exonuclease 1 n=1 Tax=Rhynchospora pubera TaxID=906938 RepID=A0AAV8HFN3_9POAL|nr:5'-3' exonuclease family protein isoform 1 [Rhynchospora pubera]
MGIQGLLPQLKSIMAPINVEDLKGQTVAVDTYSWLHKGALSCSAQLCKGLPTTRHIDYCMHRVNMLRHHGIKPILVFDGGLLPMKADQETKRARSRNENLEKAKEHDAAGNSTAAFECYQKAVDISPSIAYELIQVLKNEKVDYIVAPYEADAQMAFLSINKLVDAVITEDSDLIPFGCCRIIFKMDKFGQGVDYQSSRLPKNRELDFSGFTHQMLLEMCILSGCDYLPSLPGMGVKRAHALIQKLKSYEKVIKHVRYSGVSVPPLYEENFRRAIWAFQHQRVYDPTKQNIVHLLNVPEDCNEDLEFLGPWLEQSIAKDIAEGKLDPITKAPFEDKLSDSGLVVPDKTNPVKEPGLAFTRKRIDLPVQRNVLTNYFCLASLEAKRKFIAPKIARKHQTQEKSPPFDSEIEKADLSPSCTEDIITPPIVDKRTPLLSSPGVAIETPSQDSVSTILSMEENSLIDEVKPVENLSEDEPSDEMPKLLKPKASFDSCFVQNSAEYISNPSANRNPILKSSYFKHKQSEDHDQESLGEERNGNKENNYVRGNTYRSILKRRKLNDACNLNMDSLQPESVEKTPAPSISEEDSHQVDHDDVAMDAKYEGKFGCNVSHVNNYAGIAEKSMEKFASLISSFSYNSSGSRASGLRAPLKDVQNTRSMRSAIQRRKPAVGPVDLSDFAYTSTKQRPAKS